MSQRSLVTRSQSPPSQHDDGDDNDNKLRMPSPSPLLAQRLASAVDGGTAVEQLLVKDELQSGSQREYGRGSEQRFCQASQELLDEEAKQGGSRGSQEPFNQDPQPPASQSSQHAFSQKSKQQSSQGSQHDRSSATPTNGNPPNLPLPPLESNTAIREEPPCTPTPCASQNEANPITPDQLNPVSKANDFQNQTTRPQTPTSVNGPAADGKSGLENTPKAASNLTPPVSTETEADEEAATDVTTDLESFDWMDLGRRFEAKMAAFETEEKGLEQDFQAWLEIFRSWVETGKTHEEERAAKRLRTRMAYVQQSESTMEKKKAHLSKVVSAFESAMALFNEP